MPPEWRPGAADRLAVRITDELIDRFAGLSGDENPLHMSEPFARQHGFRGRVSHGALALSFLSALIGMRLPGPGALWRSVQVDWIAPLFPGDTLQLEVTVRQVSSGTDSLLLAVSGTNQDGRATLRGTAIVGFGEGSVGDRPPPEPVPAPASAATHLTRDRADRAVLVTGGTRGIGRAIAVELARLGHPVALTYLSRAEAAEEVVAAIRAAGGRAVALPFDADRPGDAAELVGRARHGLGPVLGLVHSGSPPIRYMAVESTSPEYLETMNRAYSGSGLALAQAILADCRAAQWGRLVYVGSGRLFGPPPENTAAYVTAKMGLWGLVRALAAELGRLGITANMISPGLTDTDFVADLSSRSKLLEGQRTPLRRLAHPGDAAALAGFLLGDEAGFITGSNLPVTGGFTMV
jgi:3-oxoacyl-[acyl-carrier protein] reductase